MSEMKSIALLASWILLASPGVARAYVDPTGGGFMLQFLLGGVTGALLLWRIAVKQALTRFWDFLRRRPRDSGSGDRGGQQE